MRDNGLEEIVKLIYPVEATVQHILKGSKYYMALRVRFLIVKALADVLNRQLSNEGFYKYKESREDSCFVGSVS